MGDRLADEHISGMAGSNLFRKKFLHRFSYPYNLFFYCGKLHLNFLYCC